MTNNHAVPVVRSKESTGPQGEQEQFKLSSDTKYIKIFQNNTEKCITNNCICYACKDSGFKYGNSSVLIEDQNPLIFQFLGKAVVK